MDSLRRVFRPWVIGALAGWTLMVLLAQIFKGGGIGGPDCYPDPSCLEATWVPWAVWAVGIVLVWQLPTCLGARTRKDSFGPVVTHPTTPCQSPNSASTASAKTSVWRSTSAAVVAGDMSAMLWNGVMRMRRFIAHR